MPWRICTIVGDRLHGTIMALGPNGLRGGHAFRLWGSWRQERHRNAWLAKLLHLGQLVGRLVPLPGRTLRRRRGRSCRNSRTLHGSRHCTELNDKTSLAECCSSIIYAELTSDISLEQIRNLITSNLWQGQFSLWKQTT